MKPFNSQYDVSTGTVAKQGAGELDPSGERLMAKLQKVYESPHSAKINALNKGIKETALNKEQAAQKAQESIQKLRTSLAQDIKSLRQGRVLSAHEIDMNTAKLIQKYKMNRILAGIGLTGVAGDKLLEYYIRREAYSGLHGRY